LPDIFYFSPLMFIKCHMAENHNFTVGARTLIGEPHPYLK
jgi:hypothetical protein